MSNGIFYTHVYRKGSNIRARVCDRYGNRRNVDKKFKPEMFVETTAGNECEFKGINGELLERVQFNSVWDMDNWIEENKDDVNVKIFGQDDPVSQFITRNFRGKIDYDWRHIRCANVDIEVVSGYRDENGEIIDGPFPEPTVNEFTFSDAAEEERYKRHVKQSQNWLKREFPDTVIPPLTDLNAAFPITLIQLSTYNNVNNTKQMMVWGLPESSARGQYQESGHYEGGYDCTYLEFETEQDLLTNFLGYWFQNAFDCWTGWNIESFDNPYLHERIRKILGPDNVVYLSPWKDIRSREYNDNKGGKIKRFIFQGCEMLDYIELYKKHRLITRESYSLDFISHVELGERKLDYKEAKTLTRLYFTNWNKYVDYGKKDIRLVDRLNDVLKYLQLSYALAFRAKCNFSDTTGTVQPWNCLMGSFLHEKGMKPLRRKQVTDKVTFAGGYVKDVIPGFYKWLISIDLNSLYPHLIQQWNLGVETIVDRHTRANIIFDICEELQDMMLSETDFKRKAALRKLRTVIQDESHDIIDELLAVGKIEFKTLKRFGVNMTPNVQFFRNDKMSISSEINREVYNSRKAYKKRMQVFEQREVWAKEFKNSNFEFGEDVVNHPAFNDEFREQLLNSEDISALAQMFSELAEGENTFQYGEKILLNSGYGSITNVWFRDYFDVRIGEAICACGRLVNRWTERELEKFINDDLGTTNYPYSVYGDTDSQYLTLENVLKIRHPDVEDKNEKIKILDEYHKNVLAPKIEEISQEICDMFNCFEQRMFWEREVISETAIWQAPKLYIMAVNNSEGVAYATPKLKFQGVAAKKSDYPEWCRERMQEVYKMCLLGKESDVKEYVSQVRKDYHLLEPDDVSAAKSVNNIEKWLAPSGSWKDGAPGHVRAAIAYNMYLREHPVPGAKPISSGDKVMLLKMKPDAPVAYKTLAYKDYLPSEWNLKPFINYELMFQANFLTPIELILSKIGWTHDKRINFTKMGGGDTDPTKHRGMNKAQLASMKGGKRKVQAETKAKRLW